MQDAGGGRVLRGVAGRGSSYIWTGEKILYTWARLLIYCPSPLPFSPLLLVVLVVSCGLDAVADSRRDGMQAGGRWLSAGSRRAAGRRAGRQAGRAVAGRLPLPSVLVLRRAGRGTGAGVLGAWRPLLGRAGVGGGRGWGVPVLGGLSRPPGGVLSVILHKVLLENTALCRK